MSERQKITVVGAGITGLTTAYYLQKAIKEQGLPYELQLLEASDRLGGKIKTTRKNGFIIERGPDSFLARKEPGVRLAKNLGLQDELIRNNTGQSYILIGDKLHKMPKGSFMGVPTTMQSLQESSLLSEEGKKRAALDLELPASDQRADQSLGHFLRYRFGDELVENIIEPLLSGIYAGDIDNMSLFATFPEFLELEQTYGSIMKGLQQTRGKPQTGQKPGQFYTFKHGLDTLVRQLEKELKNVIAYRQNVQYISLKDNRYMIQLTSGEAYTADVVIMTTPHHVLPELFSSFGFFRQFSDIPLTSVANVALAFDQSDMASDLNGTGFVVSRNSPYHFTACTWTHKKWQHTTPEGKGLLRAYVGKPTDQDIVKLSDEEITHIVLKDIEQTMHISKKPEFTVVTRWEEAMPQYTVGHKGRIRQVRDQMKASLPGVFLAGSSFEGVGLPDCIGQAEQAVEQALMYLKGN